jgi:hypothetical protein
MDINKLNTVLSTFNQLHREVNAASLFMSEPAAKEVNEAMRKLTVALVMVEDDRNDYIQNLVHYVLGGGKIEVKPSVCKAMYLYVEKEYDELVKKIEDNEMPKEVQNLRVPWKNIIIHNRGMMMAIGNGVYGWKLDKMEEHLAAPKLCMDRLIEEMEFVVSMNERIQRIVDKKEADEVNAGH